MIRPSPGRLRAILRAARMMCVRPRPASSIAPLRPPFSPIHTTTLISRIGHAPAMRAASHRSFSSSAASARRGTTLVALLKSVFSRPATAARVGLARHHFSPRSLIQAIRAANVVSFKVRSPLLQGAIYAFRTTASRTSAGSTRTAYSQLNTPTVAFSRGALSGFGASPSFGQLTLSPLRGGVGLQTSRKFSSGGARVFDNLIVNAPLVLRLAGDEVEDKAKLAQRKRPATRRTASAAAVSVRRTGVTFSAAKLPRNALVFATTAKQPSQPVQRQEVPSREESDGEELQTDLSTYFYFPQLALSTCGTVLRIRLIDPLYEALGGRDPTPPSHASGPRLFDDAFLVDANAALEYENRRYLRAKAVLRVLWDRTLLTDASEMDLVSDPALWTVTIVGSQPGEVRAVLQSELEFEFDSWCSFEIVSSADGQSATPVLSSSHASSMDVTDSEFQDISPPLSTPQRWGWDSVVESEDLISIASLSSLADRSDLLFDSRQL